MKITIEGPVKEIFEDFFGTNSSSKSSAKKSYSTDDYSSSDHDGSAIASVNSAYAEIHNVAYTNLHR